FGVDDGPKLAELRRRLQHFLALVDGPAAAFLVFPFAQFELGGLTPWGRYVRRARAIDDILYAEMARRRSEGTQGRSDILSLLLSARDEAGAPMSDLELRDEMFTLLMAGHETTATSLAWVFYQVLRHPDVLARLRDELRAVLGDGPMEPEHVGRLEYLDAVLKETQRLTPVIGMTGRLLRAPARINGWQLPAGVVVCPALYLVHRRPGLLPPPGRVPPGRLFRVRPDPLPLFPFRAGRPRAPRAAVPPPP